MIHRHRKLVGVTVWRWGNQRWVLWLCPAGEEIPTHIHAGMHAAVRMLHGAMRWWKIEGRVRRMREVDAGFVSRPFVIPAGMPHGAHAYRFSVFLVRELWDRIRPSVTCDLQEVA